MAAAHARRSLLTREPPRDHRLLVRGRAAALRGHVWIGPVLWAIYAYSLSIIIAVVSNIPLDDYQDKPQNTANRSSHPIRSGLADFKPFLTVGLVALAGVPAIVAAVKAVRKRRAANLEMIKRHLRLVQERSFPEVDGTTSKVIISLYILSKEQDRLQCIYRTDDQSPACDWPIDKTEGFVVRAFRYRVTYVAQELDPNSPEDKARYLTETWATEEIFKPRSWKGAAMLAIPVVVRPGEQAAAVFLIEATGIALADDPSYQADVQMCHMLMEDLT